MSNNARGQGMTAHSWQRQPTPPELIAQWEGYAENPPEVWKSGDLLAIMGYEPVQPEDLRWHISVSRPDRIPAWGELVEAAHVLRPGVVFVIGIPPRSWWLNVHPYALHLWQTTDDHLVGQWRYEGSGQTPT